MENIEFDEDNIPMIDQDEDYDDYYKTPDTRVDETSFIGQSDTTEATSTLRLRQKLKRNKIVLLYRYSNMTGYPDLADLDQFMIKKIQKQLILNYLFLMVTNIGNPLLINQLVSS